MSEFDIFASCFQQMINPLNTELNLICHLLVLLGVLKFMGPCIVKYIPVYVYIQQDAKLTVYLYLESALHVLGGIFTHHQERIQLYLQHLVFVTPLLLSATFVEELEPV
jgi:cytochrome c biogenesis protein CcdA